MLPETAIGVASFLDDKDVVSCIRASNEWRQLFDNDEIWYNRIPNVPCDVDFSGVSYKLEYRVYRRALQLNNQF